MLEVWAWVALWALCAGCLLSFCIALAQVHGETRRHIPRPMTRRRWVYTVERRRCCVTKVNAVAGEAGSS